MGCAAPILAASGGRAGASSNPRWASTQPPAYQGLSTMDQGLKGSPNLDFSFKYNIKYIFESPLNYKIGSQTG